MVDPVVGSSNVLELESHNLSDNGSKFTGGSTDTVSSGSVSSWEDFSWNDEGSGVWSEVLEEIGDAVKEDERSDRVGDESSVSESHTRESNGEHNESHKLNWLSSPRIDEKESDPTEKSQHWN